MSTSPRKDRKWIRWLAQAQRDEGGSGRGVHAHTHTHEHNAHMCAHTAYTYAYTDTHNPTINCLHGMNYRYKYICTEQSMKKWSLETEWWLSHKVEFWMISLSSLYIPCIVWIFNHAQMIFEESHYLWYQGKNNEVFSWANLVLELPWCQGPYGSHCQVWPGAPSLSPTLPTATEHESLPAVSLPREWACFLNTKAHL